MHSDSDGLQQIFLEASVNPRHETQDRIVNCEILKPYALQAERVRGRQRERRWKKADVRSGQEKHVSDVHFGLRARSLQTRLILVPLVHEGAILERRVSRPLLPESAKPTSHR